MYHVASADVSGLKTITVSVNHNQSLHVYYLHVVRCEHVPNTITFVAPVDTKNFIAGTKKIIAFHFHYDTRLIH